MTKVICNLRETCEVTAKILGADSIKDVSHCLHSAPHNPNGGCNVACFTHGDESWVGLPAHCEEYYEG